MNQGTNIYIDQMTDREIVAAILRRDRAITEAYFYRKCYPLFKACFDCYYTDCETVVEFINEIYLYLMIPCKGSHTSYLENFSFRCSLANWLKIVAQTYCYQLFKKKGDFFEESLDDGDRFSEILVSISTELSHFDSEDLNRVLQMMPNLRYREIIRLKYVDELSNEEVAKRLDMSIENFYNKHLLAKKQFKTALRKEGLL